MSIVLSSSSSNPSALWPDRVEDRVGVPWLGDEMEGELAPVLTVTVCHEAALADVLIGWAHVDLAEVARAMRASSFLRKVGAVIASMQLLCSSLT